MAWLKHLLLGLLVLAAGLWAVNTSMFHDGGETLLLAHRGVHQTFSQDGIDTDTCTATRIDEPTHTFLENTLPSMQAAFSAGAAVVELDVHLTPEGQFAVFHDWTLDCRTDGTGVTRTTPIAELQSLDVGYGYTADGGQSFPFRTQGAGMMPTLQEVFDRFPDRQFLINFKSRRVEEGEALASFLNGSIVARTATFGVYGGQEPTRATLASVEGLRGYDRASLEACALPLLALGWSGFVPEPCRNALIALPINIAPFVWGFPHRLTQRLAEHGSTVLLVGPYGGGGFSSGIDTDETLARVPEGFDGYVWTNKVELIAPLMALR